MRGDDKGRKLHYKGFNRKIRFPRTVEKLSMIGSKCGGSNARLIVPPPLQINQPLSSRKETKSAHVHPVTIRSRSCNSLGVGPVESPRAPVLRRRGKAQREFRKARRAALPSAPPTTTTTTAAATTTTTSAAVHQFHRDRPRGRRVRALSSRPRP